MSCAKVLHILFLIGIVVRLEFQVCVLAFTKVGYRNIYCVIESNILTRLKVSAPWLLICLNKAVRFNNVALGKVSYNKS
jgi:hypothetical protein